MLRCNTRVQCAALPRVLYLSYLRACRPWARALLAWTSRWRSQSLRGAPQNSVSPRFLVRVYNWALGWGGALSLYYSCILLEYMYCAGATYLIPLPFSLVRDSALYFEIHSAAQMTRYLCTLSILTSRIARCAILYTVQCSRTCILCSQATLSLMSTTHRFIM